MQEPRDAELSPPRAAEGARAEGGAGGRVAISDRAAASPGGVPIGDGAAPEGPAESLGSIARKLGPFSWLAGFAAFMPAVAGLVLLGNLTPVGNWLQSHGQAGLAIYVACFVVLGGLAFLPTYSQAVLGGWAFGLARGFPAALAGFLGGSLLGYFVARRVGGDRGQRLIAEHPKWKAVRDALVGGDEGAGLVRTTLIVALLRLPPNSPFALTNLVMAAAKVPPVAFAIGTLIGMTPRTLAAVYIATMIQGSLSTDAMQQARPWWVLPGAIGSAILALGVVGWIANKAVQRVTRGVGLPDEPVMSGRRRVANQAMDHESA